MVNAEIILELLKAGGPLFGPLLFAIAVLITWAYHSLLRRSDVRDYRLYMALVDKKVFTIRELREYGILPNVHDRNTSWEGVI